MRRALRWFLVGVAVLLGALVLAGLGVYVASELRLRQTFPTGVPDLPIPRDAATIERGRHLMLLAKCGECHGDDYGGKVILDAWALATLAGPNLTPGEGGWRGSDRDLLVALRHGTDPEGRPLLGMPTAEHSRFTRSELQAIVAAIDALEPVDRTVPPPRVGPLFRLLLVVGQVELIGAEYVDHAAPIPEDVEEAPTATFGEHLARTGGCYSCHGPELAGGAMPGAPPGSPPASNITPSPAGLGGWTYEDFARAMREGLRPDGSPIDPFMPVRYTRHMTDTELQALWAYLRTVPPR